MTIIKAPPVFFPAVALSTDTSGTGARNGGTLDTAGDLECYVFDVDEVDDGRQIDQLQFAMSNPSVAGDLQAMVCNIGADGRPDTGSPLGVGTVNVSSAGWYRVNITPNVTVSGNQVLGLCLYRPAGTFNGATGWMRRQMWKLFIRYPYVIRFTGTWSKISLQTVANDAPTIAAHCAGGGFLHTQGTVPFQDRVLRGSDIGEEWGIKFSLPWECAVGQVCVSMGYVANAVDSIQLGSAAYLPGDTGGTRLSAMDFVHEQGEEFSNRTHLHRFQSVVIQPATDYYLTVRPKTTAGSRSHTRNVNNNSDREDDLENVIGYPRGFNFIAVEDDGAGGWTEFPDEVPQMAVGVVGFHDTSSGGGGGAVVSQGAKVWGAS